MDNNRMAFEDIDIDENKELFEYEMTQVILELKGMFSVISDKDTHFSEHSIDDKELVVDIKKIPKVDSRIAPYINYVEVSCPQLPLVEVVKVDYKPNSVPPTKDLTGPISIFAEINVPTIDVIPPDVDSVDINPKLSNISFASSLGLSQYEIPVPLCNIMLVDNPVSTNPIDTIGNLNIEKSDINLSKLVVEPVVSLNLENFGHSFSEFKSAPKPFLHLIPLKIFTVSAAKAEVPSLIDYCHKIIDNVSPRVLMLSLDKSAFSHSSPTFFSLPTHSVFETDSFPKPNVPTSLNILPISLENLSTCQINAGISVDLPQEPDISTIDIQMFDSAALIKTVFSGSDLIPSRLKKYNNSFWQKPAVASIHTSMEHFEVSAPDYAQSIENILKTVTI